MKNVFISFSLLLLSACATKYTSNPDYITSKNYQQKETLKISLFKANGALPNDSEIQKILNSKVSIPKRAKIAVIKLQQSYDASATNWVPRNNKWDVKTFTLTDKITSDFLGELKKSPRVADVVLIPTFLTPEDASLDVLRTAAIRMQAQLLIILKPESFLDFDLNMIGNNLAKSQSTVEVVLVDSRTGIIPFSGAATRTVTLPSEDQDMSHNETIRRTQLEAEGLAMSDLANDINQFLSKIP